ncbi:MAG: DNA-directed RNA polymerase subunit P [Candidatus Methanomethyliaceae archaeon]|nr:DNA-directed RNA polymerase subunit P [Candidatus Methanomethyliaceae archaeon]
MAQYICERCRKVIDSKELLALPGIRCPACGHRILYKARSQVVREIRAR